MIIFLNEKILIKFICILFVKLHVCTHTCDMYIHSCTVQYHAYYTHTWYYTVYMYVPQDKKQKTLTVHCSIVIPSQEEDVGITL